MECITSLLLFTVVQAILKRIKFSESKCSSYIRIEEFYRKGICQDQLILQILIKAFTNFSLKQNQDQKEVKVL
jgi:hypothetical protein